MQGATIVDQTVSISAAENYVPRPLGVSMVDNSVSMFQENGSPFSEAQTTSPNSGRVYVSKAQDVVSTMLAKGSAIRHDVVNKARAFDEKHQLRANASTRVNYFDKRVGLTEKLTVGISVVNEKVKSVDQRLHVPDKTMAALMAAERELNDTGSALKSSRRRMQSLWEVLLPKPAKSLLSPLRKASVTSQVKILHLQQLRRTEKDEQSKSKEDTATRSKDQLEDLSDVKSGVKLRLSSFLLSTPIPMVSPWSFQVSDGERGTPPWAASGTPPLISCPSLRDFQSQQHGKQQQILSHSPKTKTTGFSLTTSQGSPSDSAPSNRWFKPEMDTPSTIRSIQIEERAMEDLRRFYSSVKIVKNQS